MWEITTLSEKADRMIYRVKSQISCSISLRLPSSWYFLHRACLFHLLRYRELICSSMKGTYLTLVLFLISQAGIQGLSNTDFYSHQSSFKLCVCVLSRFSRGWRFANLRNPVARRAPLPMGFSRQEYWSGLPFPPPGELSAPGMEPASLMFPALAGGFFTASAAWEEQFSSEGNPGTEKDRERCPALRNLGRWQVLCLWQRWRG